MTDPRNKAVQIENKNPANNIVIVGGGPIGLIQAIGLKKLSKGRINVTVLEKYEEYQRKHTLVMQPASLEAVMKATHTQNDPTLSALLSRLQKDPHIRTNELETEFKNLAKASDIKIINEEVKAETIKEQLSKYKPDFIIGADGTHSVVNQTLFPKANQVKIEFDYVLQYRFEIKGEAKAKGLGTVAFTQHMARHGIVANEYVGHYDKRSHSTPVTMQMMISKEDFTRLKEATSKRPIVVFPQNQKAADLPEKQKEDKNTPINFEDMPKQIQKFLTNYLSMRIQSSAKNNDTVIGDSIRISVNEAPATYAKQPTTLADGIAENATTPAMLSGDAGLGLSYFKGLNAGLLSTAKFFSLFASLIENNQMQNSGALNAAFAKYTDWFINDFAPKKIREVESYSTWNIRSFMSLMQTARSIKSASVAEDHDEDNIIFTDYFSLINNNPLAIEEFRPEKGLYPHRDHDLTKFAQWDYIPITYTLKKIGKLLADYVKPYKSRTQLTQDYKQLLVGLVNLFSGATKLVVGFFECCITGNIKRFGDGLFSALRGAIEIATYPLTLTLKPLMRGIITLFTNKPKIENNSGIQRVAQQGLNQLTKLQSEDNKLDENQKRKQYSLLAISNDLHRKFIKSLHRGQESNINLQEQKAFTDIRTNPNQATPEQFRRHFSLFAPTAPQPVSAFTPAPQSQPLANNK